MVVLGTIANNMPELPEVTTIVKILNNIVDGKTIKSVEVLRKQTIESSVDEFVKSLKDKTINNITRLGKFIVFHLSENYVIVSHLRMEGKYFQKNEGEKYDKHDLVIFHLNDNTYLAYNDTRRFGRMSLLKENNYLTSKPLCDVGPDPFMLENSKPLEIAYKSKTIPIKQALLDQSIMSGLGNIYVDEVLFETKIHPETPAKLISKKELDAILKSSKSVLQKAIDAGGSTIKSYHPAEGVNGNFQVQLQVYGHVGKPCPRCGTLLEKIFVNGRGTTFCPKCQKNKALPYILGLTGPIASGKSEIGKYLSSKGFKVIDADKIVHELYTKKEIQNKLIKIIPNLKITDNVIDRDSLRECLIASDNKKKRVEKLIHEEVKDYIHSSLRKMSNKDRVVLEVPLLFQSHLDSLCDDIIIVSLDKKTQLERLKNRNKNYESYLKLNESYYAQEDKKKATIIIINDDTIASLHSKIDKFISCK